MVWAEAEATEDEVKEMAAEVEYTDGPNDEGESFEVSCGSGYRGRRVQKLTWRGTVSDLGSSRTTFRLRTRMSRRGALLTEGRTHQI